MKAFKVIFSYGHFIDTKTKERLIPITIGILNNIELQNNLIVEITKLGKPDATASIVNEIEKII